jgi:hypothetical protein
LSIRWSSLHRMDNEKPAEVMSPVTSRRHHQPKGSTGWNSRSICLHCSEGKQFMHIASMGMHDM